MRQISNYFYISENKIDMLEPQIIKRNISMSEAKAEYSGFGLTLSLENGDLHKSLVHRLLRLLNAMKKKELIENLEDLNILKPSPTYYYDEAIWYSGLIRINSNLDLHKDEWLETYSLWRPWKDSLLFLVGSPRNVLSEKAVSNQLVCRGTSGTWESLIGFANKYFAVQDRNFVTSQDKAETIQDHLNLMNTSNSSLSEEIPIELMANPDPLSLGILCLRYLRNLQQQRLSLVFGVSRVLNINRRLSLPRWAYEMINTPELNKDIANFFWKAKRIYIGSPLYTVVT